MYQITPLVPVVLDRELADTGSTSRNTATATRKMTMTRREPNDAGDRRADDRGPVDAESRRLINWGSYEGYHEFRPSTFHKLPVTLLAGASESANPRWSTRSPAVPNRYAVQQGLELQPPERSDYTYLRGMVAWAHRNRRRAALPARPRRERRTATRVGRHRGHLSQPDHRPGASCCHTLPDARRRPAATCADGGLGQACGPRRMDQYHDAPFTPAQLKATCPDCLTFPSAEPLHTSGRNGSRRGRLSICCRSSPPTPPGSARHLQTRRARRARSHGLARTTVRDYERYDENFHAMEKIAAWTRCVIQPTANTPPHFQGACLRTGQARPSAARYRPCCATGHLAAAHDSRRPTAPPTANNLEQRGGSQLLRRRTEDPAHPSRRSPRPDAGSGRRQPDPTRTRTRPGPPHPRRRASQPNANRTNVRIHRRDAARRRTGTERTPHQRRELQTQIQQTGRRMREPSPPPSTRGPAHAATSNDCSARPHDRQRSSAPALQQMDRNPRHALPAPPDSPPPDCRTWPNSWTW